MFLGSYPGRPSSTFLYPYPFILLLPSSQPPAPEYPPLRATPRFSFPAAKPATSSSPPPRARSRLAALAAASSAFPLSQGSRYYPTGVCPRTSPLPPPAPSEPPPPPWPSGMQVSIACTEQNLRSRSSEDRLCGPRPGPGGGNGGPVGGGHGNPPGGGGLGSKSRTAVVPRPPAPAGALRESTGRGTGMKYRYGVAGQPIHSLLFWDPEVFWVSCLEPFKLSLKVWFTPPLLSH